MTEIFKISKDERRARSLREMAKERLDKISEITTPYRIIEEYYEIIKELITAFMYSQGYKTLSHKALVEFASVNMGTLAKKEIDLIDELRVARNNIVYYGEKVSSEFVKSRKEAIITIINKLLKSI